jgi:hypothetical protein
MRRPSAGRPPHLRAQIFSRDRLKFSLKKEPVKKSFVKQGGRTAMGAKFFFMSKN